MNEILLKRIMSLTNDIARMQSDLEKFKKELKMEMGINYKPVKSQAYRNPIMRILEKS